MYYVSIHVTWLRSCLREENLHASCDCDPLNMCCLHYDIGAMILTKPIRERASLIDGEEDVGVPTGRETILIIDDDRTLLGLMAWMFGSLGYQVMTAEDGITGLDLLVGREEKQLPLPDLVVLDMMLSGLSSRKVLQQLRVRYASVLVVVTSGFHGDDVANEVLGTQPDGFLPKPFAISDLARVTRMVLDRGVIRRKA